MVLDVSIVENPEPEVVIRAYTEYLHDLFTVHVDSKRILTVVTDNEDVASKWLKEVLRSTASNTKPAAPGAATTFKPDSIFVGLMAEEESVEYGPRPFDPANQPYDLLTLCVGSHCLMYELPYYSSSYWIWNEEPSFNDAPKFFKAFFQNPRVVILGTNMAKVTKRLEARHGIEIKNPVDLNELAVKGMQRHDLDLARYDFHRLTMTVLGKQFDVVKTEKLSWNRLDSYYGWNRNSRYDSDDLSNEKIMFNTVDAYLSLLICFKLLEAIDGPGESSSKKKKKKNKKKNTKRSQ
ncbi:hypothetical protein M0R45_014921 [Rubus argutus]|uniref:Uncharacterized protein n=1 Tax=Rubus argutus TaxID=59490 RepID=A0AAW1XNZ7_RUBAR